MIDKQDLHDLLYDNLLNYSKSDEYKNDMENPQHIKIMAETMQSYFEDNTEITYLWSATNPSSGSSDPVTSFKSTVKFSKWDLSMPMSLPGLAVKIMAATATGVISHAVGFAVDPGSYLIKPLILPQHSDASQCLMKCIVEPVCDWMKTLINPAPLSGTHTAYSGETTGMAIQ
jgi:hypothetical protein